MQRSSVENKMANIVVRIARSSSVNDEDLNVVVSSNTPVDEFIQTVYDKVKHQFEDNFERSHLMLFYTGKPLEYGQNKKLSDYGLVHNNSTVLMGVRAHGGTGRQLERLEPLPGFIELTTLEPDVISLDDSTDEQRAKMPCGHVISRNSMTQYCQQLLSVKKMTTSIPCPAEKCGAVWEYFMVRHVANLSAEEQTKIEAQIAENYMFMSNNFQRCPGGCGVLCSRDDRSNIRVHCGCCSKRLDKCFDFCWVCQRRWLTTNTRQQCGNPGCDGKDHRLKILKEAPLKDVNGLPNCPSIRACPKCGILISHSDGCRHMTCSTCNTMFCFICLQLGKCDIMSPHCRPAPPQTTIVGDSSAVVAVVDAPVKRSCTIL